MKKGSSFFQYYGEKIEYLMNASLYCWALWLATIEQAIQRSVFCLIRLIVLIFFPHRYLKKFYRRYLIGQKMMSPSLTNLKNGWAIGTAKDIVLAMYLGYLAPPSLLLISIVFSVIGWPRNGKGWIFIVLLMGILIFSVVNRFSKSYDKKYTYISYFKEFEKHDNIWLKKWKRNTILLFIGAIVAFLIGVNILFLCALIYRNIH